MCVLFPIEADATKTVISDVKVNSQVRELVYSNFVNTAAIELPVLMSFNISGPMVEVILREDNIRTKIVSMVNKEFDKLSKTYCQPDGVDKTFIVQTEYYTVQCMSVVDFTDNYKSVLLNLGFSEDEVIEKYEKYCLPKLIFDESLYVTVCVLRPGFEKMSDSTLAFRYTPRYNKVIIPFSHEMNDSDDRYKYDVMVYMDNVWCGGRNCHKSMLPIQRFIQGLYPKIDDSIKNIADNAVHVVNVDNSEKTCTTAIYTSVNFVDDNNQDWKIFCNGFVYDYKNNCIYVKLENVYSKYNENVVISVYNA
nr:p35 [Darna trima granulovirus]